MSASEAAASAGMGAARAFARALRLALPIARAGLGTPLLVSVAAIGLAATGYRLVHGLGASTSLSDRFPWGMWIGIDVLTGVALAGGAFSLAGIVHIFHVHRYEPLVRPAILTAMLGYMAVVVALLIDLGRPYNIWHPIIMWQPRSMLFEVAWCVMLYNTVLMLEFSPAFLEKMRFTRLLRAHRAVLIPLVMAGIILSTLHQSSLGGLYLISSTKLDPLWYSAWLPVFFWMSAVGGGLAMVIVEASLSSRAFKHDVELRLLGGVAKISATMLGLYLALRLYDLWSRDVVDILFSSWRFQNVFFLTEMLAGVALPAALMATPWVRRRPSALLAAAALAVAGLILSRIDISIVGMWDAAGTSYVPSWMELAVTAGIIAIVVLAFKTIATYLPVFGEEREPPGRPPAQPRPAGKRQPGVISRIVRAVSAPRPRRPRSLRPARRFFKRFLWKKVRDERAIE